MDASQQLAEAAGLRVATVSDLENGKLNFEINTLVSLANALGFIMDISFTPIKGINRHSA